MRIRNLDEFFGISPKAEENFPSAGDSMPEHTATADGYWLAIRDGLIHLWYQAGVSQVSEAGMLALKNVTAQIRDFASSKEPSLEQLKEIKDLLISSIKALQIANEQGRVPEVEQTFLANLSNQLPMPAPAITSWAQTETLRS